MEQTIQQQSIAFAWSFLLGLILAVVYTVIAMIRTVSPPTRTQLFFSDIIFMVLAGFANFIFAVSQTEGNLRYYTIAAETISFFLFYLTAGKFLCKISDVIFSAISSFFGIIFIPIKKLVQKATSFFNKNRTFMLKKGKI